MRSAIVVACFTFTNATVENSPNDVAKRLNALYSGFHAHQASSPLGVTISFQKNASRGFHTFCGTECFRGFTDCRYSASLYNHKMILDNNTNAFKFAYDENAAGIVFDQNLVESALGKCYYMYDGSTFTRFNGGCGCNSPVYSCTDGSAYSNQCPSSHKTCEVSDAEVSQCDCDNVRNPEAKLFEGCYWKGAALDRNHVKASGDSLRQMLKTRVSMDMRTDKPVHGGVELDRQDSTRSLVARKQVWNEVVLDAKLMLDLLALDPKAVVPAFIYKMSSSTSLNQAKLLRKSFCSQFNVRESDIPLIAVNTDVNVEEGHVFVAENVALAAEELVVNV